MTVGLYLVGLRGPRVGYVSLVLSVFNPITARDGVLRFALWVIYQQCVTGDDE